MSIMKEHDFSLFGKAVVVIAVVVVMIAALDNIRRGDPQNPFAFGVVLVGFMLFLAAKLSVIGRKQWISSGTDLMSPGMANAYRVGYWLMVVGTIATFL